MKRLILITDAFPWGNAEKSFIMPELACLKEHFKVTILSRASQKLAENRENETVLDDDIEVIHYPEPQIHRKDKMFFLCKALLDQEFIKELKVIVREKRGWECFRETYLFWIKAVIFRKWMEKQGLFNNIENKIFYSYWANYGACSLAMQKDRQPMLKFLSRMHGYDLYHERFPGGRQPFRAYIDAKINKVVFIAKVGYEYYMKHYAPDGKASDKYEICKLGVARPEHYPEKKKDDIFRIVSCSTVSDLKRVHLIAEALMKIKGCIEWHHFGTGPRMKELERLGAQLMQQNPDIGCVFHGHIENAELMRFYNENYMDCFITTSSTEGCPVSIQEAMSYGIPVIGTDVGEIRYMIDGCGVLLSANPSVDEIAAGIQKIYEADEETISCMRNAALNIWERDHQLEGNTNYFIRILNNL